MKRFFVFITRVTMHLLNYVVKANNFYYLLHYLLPEFKKCKQYSVNSSESRSNGRTIVVVVGPLLTFAKMCWI